ncbi:presqualene diphosphate synthase HpnD [Massilia agilis]|uniref:Presqualene diphosphate synthase HpnD n=1 Tax=Massilia agilis TaxID=1811226 RepID=A0ABT2DBR5_9BURK|nr:presqualene diphosphate synthase HpnD [Massilia agilis]MCS0808717.1 presqualene diphosphate synthase HpnD [Massilia agilis]
MHAQSLSMGAGAPAAAGSSFYLAMRLLPAARRDAMFSIYGFCRAVDDIADSLAPAHVRRAGLEQWRRDIDDCYGGQAPAGLRALGRHIEEYDLGREDFYSVIDGMLMDAGGEPLCAPDAATLDLYCDRVASAVGRLSVKVFGMPRADGIALAHHLGRALQLTNILRDIDEDAALGRVYLPGEALRGAGVAPGSAACIVDDPALPDACARVVPQVQAHFRHAEAILRHSRCRTAHMMSAAYQAVLARLLARGWEPPRAPVKVPRVQKIGILLRHLM